MRKTYNKQSRYISKYGRYSRSTGSHFSIRKHAGHRRYGAARDGVLDVVGVHDPAFSTPAPASRGRRERGGRMDDVVVRKYLRRDEDGQPSWNPASTIRRIQQGASDVMRGMPSAERFVESVGENYEALRSYIPGLPTLPQLAGGAVAAALARPGVHAIMN